MHCDTTNHIKCEVKNCSYNSECCCTANEVKIGPSFAVTKADTICGTFKEEK